MKSRSTALTIASAALTTDDGGLVVATIETTAHQRAASN
jgi:hypothetical protein